MFFKKIKLKLKVMHCIWIFFITALTVLLCLGVFSIGFSTEMNWQIGVRGSNSGIPVPNWLLSALILLVVVFCLVMLLAHLKALIMDTEYHKMLRDVATVGDVDTIDTMLSSMSKNKYVKGGDLRFNEKIIFHMAGSSVTVISPMRVQGIKTEIVRGGGTETNFVCIYYANGILKIKTREKHVLLLLEELRNAFPNR